MNWTQEQLQERERTFGQVGSKETKYHSRKKCVNGITFDSAKEANRYLELRIQQQCGAIYALELQPRFVLQKAFVDSAGKRHRRIEYRADFEYSRMGTDVDTVEDVKGYKTPVYRMKIKLFRAKYPEIEFVES